MNEETVPKATHEGEININGIKINSYNLDNGQRVLSRIGFLKAIGRTGKAKGGREYDEEFKTPVFLTANNLKPFIDKDLLENSTPIIFKDRNNNRAIGYNAALLPSVCFVFMDAHEKGVLHSNQIHIAERAKILARGFATIGIIALIDEATGFQYERDKDSLHKILEAYVNKEFLPWTKRFPDEFYIELFRLRKWDWSPLKVHKPKYVGKLTNELIYQQLPPGVLDELKKKTPKSSAGNYTKRFHQSLTDDIGNPHLEKQVVAVTILMKISSNWSKFKSHFAKAFGAQQIIDFPEQDDL